MQSVLITTKVVSLNPAQAIQHCDKSLSVTYGRSVVFSGKSTSKEFVLKNWAKIEVKMG
jgi:hypothetical protein